MRAQTPLEVITEKLQQKKSEELEEILMRSGSMASKKNEYGITVIDDTDAASSLVFKSINRPKLDKGEIEKAIDIDITELKPNIPTKRKDLVPKPLYDEQVALVADLTIQVNDLNSQIADLNNQISALETQVETEINNRLTIEQTNDALANQLASLTTTIEDFSNQIQSAVQKSVEESILRASLQSQNAGFKVQVEALIKQIDSLNSIIEGLQAQIGAVQQQQAIENSTKNLAQAAGGYVINDISFVSFDPPWQQDDTKIVGRFKSGGGCRWDRGGTITINNNDTSPISVTLNHSVRPANRDFFTMPETQFEVPAQSNKEIKFNLNEAAVSDLESRPKSGPFGGHKGSQTYTGGKFVIAVTRKSNNVTKDISFATAFEKKHPDSY